MIKYISTEEMTVVDLCLYEKSPDLIAKSHHLENNKTLIKWKCPEARQQSHSDCVVESRCVTWKTIAATYLL